MFMSREDLTQVIVFSQGGVFTLKLKSGLLACFISCTNTKLDVKISFKVAFGSTKWH